MDLRFTPEEEAFRGEVLQFLREKLPQRLSHKVKNGLRLAREDMAEWHAILNERGWLANHWPKEYGGPGWGAVQKFIFENECALAGAPRVVAFGVNMLGPVLVKYGNEAQKAHWLPRILNGEDWWCQGYSEPGSGSDLASVKTTAVLDGDHYVVNGQKTWTTLGHFANMIFCLVRTNREAKAQSGISFLLVDMNTPGVEVRPIITLDGDHEVNEVFFTDVRVPAENLVGEQDKGWTYAKYLLGHERTGIAGIGHCYRELHLLKHYARETTDGRGRRLIDDVRMRDKIARLEMDLMALEMLLLRVATQAAGTLGPEASIVKIRGSELQQDIAMLQMEVAGPNGWPYSPNWMEPGSPKVVSGPDWAAPASSTYYDMRKTTIYGGTTEVQKSIISKMIIGF